jgi:hypothetical protein
LDRRATLDGDNDLMSTFPELEDFKTTAGTIKQLKMRLPTYDEDYQMTLGDKWSEAIIITCGIAISFVL